METELLTLLRSTKPDLAKLPGGWEPPDKLVPRLDEASQISIQALKEVSAEFGVAFVAKNVLTSKEIERLLYLMDQSPNFESVSVQGRKDIPDYRMGSIRTSIWAPELALSLWKKLQEHFIYIRLMNDYTATDWWQGDKEGDKERRYWKPVGITPLMRFMRYQKDGQHYAHYDAGFFYPDDNYRTLQSAVIYLTTCPQDGTTRFIKDHQKQLPIWERSHADWIREVKPEEVIASVHPQAGDILIFDHRICHDVEKYTGDTPRIIIRADILFKAV